jgi:putative oxidoreductase
MRSPLLATRNDVAPLIARVTLGIVIFPHGAQKVLGWFGGPGLTGTMALFHGVMHIPTPLAALDPIAEFLGALALIIGLLSRVAAFSITCVMLVAVSLVQYPNGFFMNWTGHQQGEGFEYHLLAIGLALIVLAKGGGAWSVDRAITSAGGHAGESPVSSSL